MRKNYKRYQVGVFPALLFIFIGPALVEFWPPQETEVTMGFFYRLAIVIPVSCVLFFVTLRFRCMDCGATGWFSFGVRHECEAVRQRRQADTPIVLVHRQSTVFLVFACVLGALIVEIVLAGLLYRP